MAASERAIDKERRKTATEKAMEHAVVMFLMVIPLWTATAAFGLMMLFGALHSIDFTVPAIGYWTSVGVCFGLVIVLYVIRRVLFIRSWREK